MQLAFASKKASKRVSEGGRKEVGGGGREDLLHPPPPAGLRWRRRAPSHDRAGRRRGPLRAVETLERACEEGRVLPAMGAAVAAAQRHCSASLGRRGAPPCAFPGVPGGARRGPGSGGRQAVNRNRPNLNVSVRFVTAAQANGWRSPAQVAGRCRHSDVGTRNGCHFTARRAAGARGCGSSEHWCNKPALMRSSCLVPPLPQPPLPPPRAAAAAALLKVLLTWTSLASTPSSTTGKHFSGLARTKHLKPQCTDRKMP